MDSILNSIKKLLGITAEYTQFDTDITIHINTIISILSQIGVGPTTGFVITSATDKWSDWLTTSTDLESVKTYIYLRVRLLFDPQNKFSSNKIIRTNNQRVGVSITHNYRSTVNRGGA